MSAGNIMVDYLNILLLTKVSIFRQLSVKDDMANNATQLLDCLLNFLVTEHLDYALELGLHAVPIAEGKSPPQIYFFDVVRQCNAIIHLLEKLFADSVIPLVM